MPYFPWWVWTGFLVLSRRSSVPLLTVFLSSYFFSVVMSVYVYLMNVVLEVCVSDQAYGEHRHVLVLLCSPCLCAAATPAWVHWSGLIIGKACCLWVLYLILLYTHALFLRILNVSTGDEGQCLLLWRVDLTGLTALFVNGVISSPLNNRSILLRWSDPSVSSWFPLSVCGYGNSVMQHIPGLWSLASAKRLCQMNNTTALISEGKRVQKGKNRALGSM